MKRKIKGFTLVELIIAIALMAILMVMVGLIMKPISQVFADTSKYTEDRYVMDGMAAIIDENLKYADRICIIYDTEARNIGSATNPLDDVAEQMGLTVADESRIQVLAIINKMPDPSSCPASWIDDFTNNSGVETTGKIYKSTYVDGTRKWWLVGGEAFYGDGSYFVNLENTAGVDHMTPGDIEYTIYSFDPKKYEKMDPLDVSLMLASMRDHTREEIKSNPYNDVISNYAEKGIRFVNSPNFGQISADGVDGWVSPIDGSLGASSSQGNAGTGTFVTPDTGAGYNIFIYYTVPN